MINEVFILFHILVLQEYFVLAKSMIKLKPIASPSILMNKLNEMESDVFKRSSSNKACIIPKDL